MMTWTGFRLLFLVIFALIRFLCLINSNKCSYFNILLLNYSFWQTNWWVIAVIVSQGQNSVFFLDFLKPPNLRIAISPQHHSNDCLQHGPDQVPHGQTSVHAAAGELWVPGDQIPHHLCRWPLTATISIILILIPTTRVVSIWLVGRRSLWSDPIRTIRPPVLIKSFVHGCAQGATTCRMWSSTGPGGTTRSKVWTRWGWLSTVWRATTPLCQRLCTRQVDIPEFPGPVGRLDGRRHRYGYSLSLF